MRVANKKYTKPNVSHTHLKASEKQALLLAVQENQAVKGVIMANDCIEEGHGFLENREPDTMVRVTLEKLNSQKYFTEKNHCTRTKTIDQTREMLQVDLTEGCESQTARDLVLKEEGEKYHDFFWMSEDKKSMCAHTGIELLVKSQYRITRMMANGVYWSLVK